MADFNIEEFASQIGIDIDVKQIRKKTLEFYRTLPGFFTPFNSGPDIGATLATPFIASLGIGTISALLAIASSVSGAVCIASLVASGICAAANKTDARNTSLTVAAISGIITLVAPLISAIASILLVVATAAALTYVVTRTGASIVAAIQSCFPHAKADDAEQDADPAVGL